MKSHSIHSIQSLKKLQAFRIKKKTLVKELKSIDSVAGNHFVEENFATINSAKISGNRKVIKIPTVTHPIVAQTIIEKHSKVEAVEINKVQSADNSKNHFWYLLSLLLIPPFIYLKFGKTHLSRISMWATTHKAKAQWALAILKTLSGVGSLFLGKLLFDNHLLLSENFLYGTLFSGATALLIYPIKHSRLKIFSSGFIKSKFLMTITALSTSLCFVSLGNLTMQNENYIPQVSPCVKYVMTGNVIENKSSLPASFDKMEMEKKDESSVRKAANFLLVLLILMFLSALSTLILALSCSLACSGMGELALIVLLVGGLLLLMITIGLFKLFFRKKTKIIYTPK